MLKFILILSSLIYLVAAHGHFVVLRSPKSLVFAGNEEIDAEEIPDVLATALGFTTRTNSNWNGMTVKNPFGWAKRVVVIAINGVSDLGKFDEVPVFTAALNQDERTLWEMLEEDLRAHFPTDYDQHEFYRIKFPLPGTKVTTDFLQSRNITDSNHAEEHTFFQDLVALDNYKKELQENEDLLSPTVNWLSLKGMHQIQLINGADYPKMNEFKDALRTELVELGDAFDDDSLVVLIIGDAHVFRSYRPIRAAGDAPNNDTAPSNAVPGNQATVFTSNYPAIFNIMLWFGVTFVLSLIAISYFIGTMDPGRDSIIYRMTSNRMKKDS